MKLSKEALRQIRQFAKDRIGGFGMWIELAEKKGWIGDEKVYSYNMLFTHDENTRDLNDFINWQDCKTEDIELINGFAWLDFHVHDRNELKDHVQALIDSNGNVVKLWLTWANEEELERLIHLQTA
jgi:hypothetical protein